MTRNDKNTGTNSSIQSGKNESSLKIPTISLPKGGGAIKGIDEKFEVNSTNGTVNLSIGLPISPGRSGFTPGLGLNYNSGGGNSPFGLGWQLSIGSISRKTDKGIPRYREEEEDTFVLTGAEDLVPFLAQESPDNWVIVEKTTADGYTVKRYRPRIEGSHARIEKISHSNHGTFWKVTTSDNIVTIYGRTKEARIYDPEDESKIFQWFAEFSYDDKGNWIKYNYKAENLENVPRVIYEENRLDGTSTFANIYLKNVQYGNQKPYYAASDKPYDPIDPTLDSESPEAIHFFDLIFDYGEHDDLIPKIEEDPALNWNYRQDSFSNRRAGFEIRTNRLCKRVLMFHHFKELGDEPCLVKSLQLAYSGSNMNGSGQTEVTYLTAATQSGYIRQEDKSYSKKSFPSVEYSYQTLDWNTEIKKVDESTLANAPVGLTNNYQWVDLYGEGISGILSVESDNWYYKENLGGFDTGQAQFTPAHQVQLMPSLSGLNDGTLVLQDLKANGEKQITINNRGISGFYGLDNLGEDQLSFHPFTAFKSIPNINFNDPNIRFFDLTGNGVADIVVTEENVFTWYAGLGEEGYREAERASMIFDEQSGPGLVFSDTEQSIFLADMTGDGLTDIIRIRNGEVVYWANLGYGKFSSKVMMGNSPRFDSPDLFNPQFLHMADVSGTGATDIIYLGGNSFKAYINNSGNALNNAFEFNPFPKIHQHGKLSVVDLLGSGTASIVWSSDLPGEHPMQYIDLTGSKKPHLLIGYQNNCGKEVSFEFKSSTYFYLKDKKEGNPWITKLPFPVQLVSKTSVEDKISEFIFTSNYSYRHGYFDHVEREFRGFARVEQLDTEAFNRFKLNNAKNVVEEELHQAPVKTITWFHTGAFKHKVNHLHQLRDEYFSNAAFNEFELIEPSIDDELDTITFIEAMRALKGTPIHAEIYAEDGTEKSEFPFSSSSSSNKIKLVQPRGKNKYASFQVIPEESITYNYDRNPEDPRISHSFVLETDEIGNVTKSASVIYPRVRRPIGDKAIPDRVWDEQNQLNVIYGEIDFTNDILSDQTYRLRNPFESRAYELKGISQPLDFYFNRINLFDEINAAATILYDQDFTTGIEKRLTAHSRTYFMKDDLSGALPLSQLSSLGMVFNSHQLAFTKDLVPKYFGAKVNDAMLLGAKYLHLEGDEHWWTQGGTVVYDGNPKDNFYLPIGGRDVFGNTSSVTYDDYFLLTESTTNALGHSASAINDYRLLAPVLMTDANLNRSAIETDELGVVIKSAIMGKEGLNEGDTLENPSSKITYDIFNWQVNKKPNYVHDFVRDEHGVENPVWQESYSYFNGSGGVILTKVQAEPGLAKRWNSLTQKVDEIIANPRWVGNGRTIVNNKGNVIKSYDPYFSTTHDYESEDALVETGFSSLLYYDAAGRNIKTDLPDGTFTKAEFDGWHNNLFDVIDTVKDSQWYSDRSSPDPLIDPEPVDPEQRAAWLAAKHHNTPVVVHSNTLGQIFYSVTDHGGGKTTNVYSSTDIAKRYAKVYDEKGRLVSEAYTNVLKAPIYAKSDEKGERWTFLDVMGRPVKIWDNDLYELRMTFDVLNRPVSTFVKQGGVETLFSHLVYGDILMDAIDKNALGKVYQSYDQSGVIRVKLTDFKGNVLAVDRTLCKDYKQLIDWKVLEGLTDISTIETTAAPFLESETFTFSTELDALNRPILTTLPDGTLIKPSYNEANRLDSLEVKVRGLGNYKTFLEDQNYNAKGERQYVKFGNGLITKYFYNPKSFRLVNMITKVDGDLDSNSIQNLNYTFDSGGNIVQITDDAQQTHFFNNAVVKAENLFEYDALSQLIKATGREHASSGMNPQPNDQSLPFLSQLPHANNTTAVRKYTQTYQYDDLGNILEMKHLANNGNWTRQYHYEYQNDPSNRTNRLSATSQPNDPVGGPYSDNYNHDLHGNMTKMTHLNQMVWNFMDQLKEVDLGGGGKGYYVYDIQGTRVRKIIERIGGKRTERIYLGSIEIYREYQGINKKLERNTLHISDNTGKIAQVDTKLLDVDNIDKDNPLNTDLIRYQYSNHIGSAAIETDETGVVISYEEYHPFGTSAYRNSKSGTNLSLKRYRFTGQERDDETGFYHMGARYYAAWLGRWTSSDPAGFVDGFNLYRYSRNNPIMFNDPSGTDPKTDRVTSQTSQEVADARTQNTDAARAIIDRAFPVGSEVQGRNGRYRITGGSRWSGTENRLVWTEITGDEVPAAPPATPEDPPEDPPPASSGGGSNTTSAVPIRPAIQPGPVPSVGLTPTSPIPLYDLPQAPPGTDFRAAERAGRANLRNLVPHGPGEQAQHNLKWRIGRNLNLDPRITNDRRYMNPLQSRNALSNGPFQANGRTFNNPHTWADRGLYPEYEGQVRSEIGSHSSERVIHLETGRRVQQRTTGQAGPRPSANPFSSAPRLIWGPRALGMAGHATLGITRAAVPGVVEAELVFGTGAMYAYAAGYTTLGAGLTAAAAYTPVVGGSAVAGAFFGNLAEGGARSLGASDEVAYSVGALGAVGAGAGVGALIGSVIPVVGTGVGAAVGAIVGLIGYGLSKLF